MVGQIRTSIFLYVGPHVLCSVLKQNTNIPPIIHDGVYILNFKRKAEIFNQYFANQCKINDNGSVLPPLVPRLMHLYLVFLSNY